MKLKCTSKKLYFRITYPYSNMEGIYAKENEDIFKQTFKTKTNCRQVDVRFE